jgi:hypothetical protein
MERLPTKNEHGEIVFSRNMISEIVIKLAGYEDLEDKLDQKFSGCITLEKIVNSFTEYFDQQEKDEELANCMLITNDNVRKYKQWKEADEKGLLQIQNEKDSSKKEVSL